MSEVQLQFKNFTESVFQRETVHESPQHEDQLMCVQLEYFLMIGVNLFT